MTGLTGLPIGELSRRTGCNIETIRYYERIGLIPPPPRRGRYRSYDGDDVARLGFVRRARELGFTLVEVRALLGLAAGGEATCTEVRDLAAAHLTDVRARIADLRRMERVLAASVRACDAGEDAGCPLVESLYARSPDHRPTLTAAGRRVSVRGEADAACRLRPRG